MQNKEELDKRIENLEKQIQVIMSMINHLNTTYSLNVLSKIEDVIDKAVNKKINYINNNKTSND